MLQFTQVIQSVSKEGGVAYGNNMVRYLIVNAIMQMPKRQLAQRKSREERVTNEGQSSQADNW